MILNFSEYDADYLLNKFSDFLCPAHVPEGQACATPLNPGVYGGEPAIEVREIFARRKKLSWIGKEMF